MSKPIIPWIGGKRRLADRIFKRFPVHTCYVEVFAGAAALYFMKHPSEVEVINDINGELVNLYRVIKCHLEEFVRQFKWALSSRKVYEWEQAKPPETMTDIQRAARFFYLQKLSFGGKVDGQVFGTATTTPPRLNLLRIEEDLSQAHLRLQSTYIENLPWQKMVRKYDRCHTLFYLDPPYWGTEGYGVDFGLEQYGEMGQLAASIDGAMVISVNDCAEMRAAFRGLHMEEVDISYTVGGGEGVPAKELLIWNERADQAPKNAVTMPLFGGF